MPDPVADTIALAAQQEALRQQRETFDQRKTQDHRWFILRFVMGWIAVALLPGIGFTSGWIIFHSRDFTTATITAATTALLVDTIGLVISVWKIVLGPGQQALGPVTVTSTNPARGKASN